MNVLSAGWFVTGVEVNGPARFVLAALLCLSIAVVYKTTRCRELREIPMAVLVLWVTIVISMYALGVGLWVVFSILT
jgi:hypothetical protein